MSTNQSTGRIKIIKVPAGEAPDFVREAWLGLTLPCDAVWGLPDNGMHKGVLSGEQVNVYKRNCGGLGFSVPQEPALYVLEQFAPKAAAWWRQHGFPRCPPEDYFDFALDEAEIIEGVTMQRIIHVTEEMQGDPYR